MKKIGVLLSGSGVYDGSEIHEAVLTLLAIAQKGAKAVCMAPDVNQYHVVNHTNGEEMNETRNVLVESARIARGEIQDVKSVDLSELDALAIPGGFGTAKNHTDWAFNGPDGTINGDVQALIRGMVDAKKPILAMCMGPTTVAKALQDSAVHATLSVGTDQEASSYEIDAISQGMEKVGAKPVMKTVREIAIDEENKIISAPCYMMEANIVDVHNNIQQAVDALMDLI